MAFHLARANHELSKTNHSLLPHQIDALKWMVRRESTKGPKGGILADDMGLGKTLETISLILSSKITNTLIIVPANLVDQWISEFTKFAPHISVSNNIGDHQEGTIIITSYIKAIRTGDPNETELTYWMFSYDFKSQNKEWHPEDKNLLKRKQKRNTLIFILYINVFLIFLTFTSFIAHLLEMIINIQRFSYPI